MMGQRRVTVTFCDSCGQEPAETYRIGLPDGRPRAVDLCSEHAKPIIDLLGRAASTTDRRRIGVTTIEQIEEMKRQRREESGI